MTEGAALWRVVVKVPLRRTYVYEVPDSLGVPLRGARVLVPFGPRRVTGYLLEPVSDSLETTFTIKRALRIIDDRPVVPGELLDFLLEASSYYMHPIGEAIATALPSGIDYSEKQGDLKGPRIRVRKTKVILSTSEGRRTGEVLEKLERQAPASAALLKHIVEEREISLADLKRYNRNASSLVQRLRERGLVRIEERERAADPFYGAPVAPDVPPVLNEEQVSAVLAITAQIEQGGYRGFLLHGVTGSGKTEVYLHAIEKVLDQGRGAIVLVPEIALTPQLVNRYRARFGDSLAVWHSGLSERERFDEWRKLREGQVQVCIGVRSAVFTPVERLGIIIVDEEHDSSFKQETGFHYHARDLALLRAARAGATAVLGSATPALETLYNAEKGKLVRLELLTRATDHPLPRVEIVNLTAHRTGPAGQRLIAQPLFAAISSALEREEQVILFLNRRGFAPALLCTDCGQLIRCRSCAVSMTFHKQPPRLVCHYCDAQVALPEQCPECRSTELLPVGAGTQKAEETIEGLFPQARVGRLDRDTGAGKRAEQVLDRLRRREIDILVGTQMVTKGHDFPGVTLVGVLNADMGLQMPDFRASERSFQLLTQVSGRAGRSTRPGLAMIQTYNPDHPAIRFASRHDWDGFSKVEMGFRKELGYPPFGRLAQLRLSATEVEKVEEEARDLFAQLREIATQQQQAQLELLGPAPAPMAFIQGRHRFRILIKAPRQDQIRRLLAPLIPRIEAPRKGVRIILDIDPHAML